MSRARGATPWILVSAGGPVTDAAFLADHVATRPPPREVIAVDSGIHHLVKIGLEPDLHIGDMDSAGSAPAHVSLGPTVKRRIFPRDKDQTDLELALEHVRRAHRPCGVVIVGGIGGRIDHSLTNLFLLTPLLKAGFDPVFLDRDSRVRLVTRRVILPRDHYHWVSLIPLTRRVTGITTRGLRFPLAAGTLHQDRGRGVSNEYAAARATVSLESGALMVVESPLEIAIPA